jgi:hypothetical protein
VKGGPHGPPFSSLFISDLNAVAPAPGGGQQIGQMAIYQTIREHDRRAKRAGGCFQ